MTKNDTLEKRIRHLGQTILALQVLMLVIPLSGCDKTDEEPPFIGDPLSCVFHCPSFNNTGDKIVFVWTPSVIPGVRHKVPDGIYIMNSDGTGKRPILQSPLVDTAERPRFSPSGDWIAFSAGVIWKINSTADSLVRLYDGGWSVEPNWSSDGGFLAFGSNEGSPVVNRYYLRICDASGLDNQPLLVGDSPIVCRFPSWLYSQRSIMFVEPLTHYIIKYNLTTSDLDTVMSDVYLRCFDLAGNDSTMVYEHDSRIWIRQGNGLAPVCLFNRWGRDPSISRDGQRVLFVGSDSESQYDAIWIASTDGTWVTQLTSASDWLGP